MNRERACTQKDAYADYASARAAMLMRGMQYRLHAYECPYCGSWHLTRRRPEQSSDDPSIWE